MKSTMMISAVVIAALGVTAVAASAKEGGKMRHMRGQMPSFEQLDTNGDGFITVEEMAAKAAERFAGIDVDGDGVITKEELTAFAESKGNDRMVKKLDHMMSRMDANGDGQLSVDEMKPKGDRTAKMLEKFDTDGDGKISKAEFDAAQAARAGKRSERKAEMFKALDTNGDGSISQEEWDAAKEARGFKKHGDTQEN
ncbi:EF-hand domain-containing protein [uncultured Shimia sp.]|uniref:EF-hand domain-containing protein n=1 Tax=uncultured Shimia sp. TaxID=573152 RepID=UPI0025E90194|nr:EF-hand domain-containing protein [uncultured Shimia sp.]